MSHITLSAPAQERIRQRLRTEASRSPRHSVWRAMLPAACLALMLTAGIFLALSRQTSTPPTGSVSSGGFQIQSASSAEELSELVGFSVPEPEDVPFPVTQTAYTALSGNTAQIRCSGDTQDMTFRMTPGNEDPSGDYTDYPPPGKLPLTESPSPFAAAGPTGPWPSGLMADTPAPCGSPPPSIWTPSHELWRGCSKPKPAGDRSPPAGSRFSKRNSSPRPLYALPHMPLPEPLPAPQSKEPPPEDILSSGGTFAFYRITTLQKSQTAATARAGAPEKP